MKKIKSTLPNMWLSLMGICFLAAVVLSFVNSLTQEPIKKSKTEALERAIGEVVPEFDNSPLKEVMRIGLGNDTLQVYPASKSGKIVGYAIESTSSKGFSGNVNVLIGVDPQKKILNYSVLEMSETPGLGDKMFTWFKSTKPSQSIIGRDLSQGALRVSKDGGTVDAITAATISSRAFLDAVNKVPEALDEVMKIKQ